MAETHGNDIQSTQSTLTLDQVHDDILKLLAAGHAGQHEIGWLYNYVVEHRLAQGSGFKDAKEFFSTRVKVLSQSALSMYGAVAREFTAEACKRYGVTNLGMLLRYEQTANIEADANDPGPTPISVPDDDTGAVSTKPFSECTVEDLKRATQTRRAPNAKPLPAEDSNRLKTLRTSLPKHFSERARGRIQVSAQVKRGQTLVSFTDVPMSELTALIEALMEETPPLRVVA
jgi:hypothetical protein